jgi:hypothetical protein
MRRREFITLVSSATAAPVAWPPAARRQQAFTQPHGGMLSPVSSTTKARTIEALRAGFGGMY